MKASTDLPSISSSDHYRRVRWCVLAAALLAFPAGVALGVAGMARGGATTSATHGEGLAVASRALKREQEERERRVTCQDELTRLRAASVGGAL